MTSGRSPSASFTVPVVGIVIAAFVANLYYAQPLAAFVAQDLGIGQAHAGAIVSASQFGYGVGLFLIVPLADTVENRRLVLVCSGLVTSALAGLAVAPDALTFLACGFIAGMASSGAQILTPYLFHILVPERRGQVMGLVGAGVLATVMLARPLALFVTAEAGWRALYGGAAILTALLGLVLSAVMTPHSSGTAMRYADTLRSMIALFAVDRRVQRRTACQAAIFASFTLFWATTPLLLAQRFNLGIEDIGLIALVAAGGALTAPIAGRLADAGLGRPAMRLAILLIAACFGGSMWAASAASLALLALAAFLLDGAVQATQTFSRLAVLDVSTAVRGRVNAIYMTIIYMCGAAGSLAGVLVYTRFGWTTTALLGAILAGAALWAALAEDRRPAPAASDPPA